MKEPKGRGRNVYIEEHYIYTYHRVLFGWTNQEKNMCNAARVRETGIAYNFYFFREKWMKRLFSRRRHIWKENINICLKWFGRELWTGLSIWLKTGPLQRGNIIVALGYIRKRSSSAAWATIGFSGTQVHRDSCYGIQFTIKLAPDLLRYNTVKSGLLCYKYWLG
jgi:hypothetical protein